MKDIFFTQDLLKDERFLKLLEKDTNRFALIADEIVGKLYGETLLEFMESKGLSCTLIPFPCGEKHKNRWQKEQIEDALIANTFGRNTTLIVMGGGVATDLGGFVAATYLRGVPYISIPTTLLGMVDASIGGKTGVNLKEGKNLIGAIYKPKAILMDLTMLRTLPEREMLNGCAEVIKYGLISDSSLIKKLKNHASEWKLRDTKLIEDFVQTSAQIKTKVVSHDLYESGERRILNFGHTIGHAIELIEDYKISHGEAIAIGMIVEALMAYKMGHLKESDFQEVYDIFKFMDFPLTLSSRVTKAKIYEALKSDKKARSGSVRFVILSGIGHVESFKGTYCASVDDEILSEALGWMATEFVK